MSTTPSKNALCIGATNGIGRAMALHLAQCQANVVIAGRNLEGGKAVLDEIKAIHPSGNHAFIPCDASLLKNVKNCCTEYEGTRRSLDYLVMTQSITSLEGRSETVEGIDRKMALHYYGRIQFIQSLLPLMLTTARSGGDVRVMSVMSAGLHTYTHLDDLEVKHNYSLKNAADAAGYYNDLAMDRLAEDNPSITFVHAFPGGVRSAWGSGFPAPLRLIVRFAQLFATPAETCAANLSRALLEDSYRGGMHLIGARGQEVPKTKMHTVEIRDKVWKHTMEMLGRVGA